MSSRAEVLKLYKNLLLYSKKVRLTDASYYRKRISSEFKQNKTLTVTEEIIYAYKKGEALLQRGSIV